MSENKYPIERETELDRALTFFDEQTTQTGEIRIRLGGSRRQWLRLVLDEVSRLREYEQSVIEQRRAAGSVKSVKKVKNAAKIGAEYGGRKRRIQIYVGPLRINNKVGVYYFGAHDKRELEQLISKYRGDVFEFRYVKDKETIGVEREKITERVGVPFEVPKGF